MLSLLLDAANDVTGTAAVRTLDDFTAAAGLETITGTAASLTFDDLVAAAGLESITGTAAITTLDDIAMGLDYTQVLRRQPVTLSSIYTPARQDPSTHIGEG